MKDRFVPPELQALLGDPMIDIPVSGGGGLQSIGNGRYAVTCPMASRSSWTSTATSSAETPQAEGWLIHPSASHT